MISSGGIFAGADAAIGVKMDVGSRDVPIAVLRDVLRQHGAMLPDVH